MKKFLIYLLCFISSGIVLLVCGFSYLLYLPTQNDGTLGATTFIGFTLIFSAIAFAFVIMYMKINDLKWQVKHLVEKVEEKEEKNK